MPPSTEVLLLLGSTIAAAVLSVVYMCACCVRDAVEVHDLKIRVVNLRNERLAYLRDQHSEETIVTDIALPGVNAASPGQGPEMVGGSGSTSKRRH
jgi:hypothetical protein